MTGDPLEEFHQRVVLVRGDAFHHPGAKDPGAVGDPPVGLAALVGQGDGVVVGCPCHPPAFDEVVDVRALTAFVRSFGQVAPGDH
ncbi:hypothetical protein F7Q99_01675 [Streptomyces kaniharaensis]|uniref:Uncharacterized protein n=1 Tax=Streptomyces kaniharaensis TaxID=212423 RepID=A0A6N7KN19_9ACTN|nr:hypothetical protein [Streptomyces kaniharaensis]MQS11023.1 hypothetical protein [Streptomyces kaniharaensis]